MGRVEQLAEHLKRSLSAPVIVGSLGNAPLPAVIINWTDRPYTDEGMVFLDATEPEGPMQIQIDGWVEIEWCELTNDLKLKRKSREAKALSKQLLDSIVDAVEAFAAEKAKVHRTLDRAANNVGNRRRVTVNLEMEPAALLLESDG